MPRSNNFTSQGSINSNSKLDDDHRRDNDVSPDFVLKNEGSMVQNRRNINVQVVSTDIC